MQNPSNLEMIHNMYHDFARGNIAAVMSCFDPDIVWERPGDPDIPFAGVFRGHDGLSKMFSIIAQTLKIKEFVPEEFCSSENTVAVLGRDEVQVIPTGKTYVTKWVQAFTFRNGKIIYVHAYLDSLTIAKAFQS